MIACSKQFSITLILLGIILSLHGQDILNYSNSLKYANYLFQNRNYSLSAIEYERVSYLEPHDTLAKLRTVQSLRLMRDYESAKIKLESLFPIRISDYPEDFADEYFTILFQQNQFSEAINYINENKTINQVQKAAYKTGALLKQYKWTEAKSVANQYKDTKQPTYKLSTLANIADQGMAIKYKKPGTAALFSALIPGSGKVYTKNLKDGIYAFVFISTFSWLTYRSVSNKDLAFNSVFYGSVTFSFYLANIYGSYKSALKYNEKVNQRTTKDIHNILFEH